MLHTTFIISYFDPVQITITISYVFSILYHINVYRILLLMPASSVAIALALRKNRSLGKTFWFTVKGYGILSQFPVNQANVVEGRANTCTIADLLTNG